MSDTKRSVSASAKPVTSRRMAACTAGSRTTPWAPSRSRPASNCGLMSATASPPQTLAARLELRLDEDQSRSVRGQKRVDRRKDEGQGDEGGVADGEADRLVEVGGGQVPGVRPVHDGDAWVGGQAPKQLAVPDVHGVDPPRATVQKDVREPPGGGADIGTDAAVRVQRKDLEGPQQLVGAAAGPAPPLLHLQTALRGQGGPRLGHDRAVGPNLPGHDQRLGPVPCLGQAAVHQQLVQTFPSGHPIGPRPQAVWARTGRTDRHSERMFSAVRP